MNKREGGKMALSEDLKWLDEFEAGKEAERQRVKKLMGKWHPYERTDWLSLTCIGVAIFVVLLAL